MESQQLPDDAHEKPCTVGYADAGHIPSPYVMCHRCSPQYRGTNALQRTTCIENDGEVVTSCSPHRLHRTAVYRVATCWFNCAQLHVLYSLLGCSTGCTPHKMLDSRDRATATAVSAGAGAGTSLSPARCIRCGNAAQDSAWIYIKHPAMQPIHLCTRGHMPNQNTLP